MATELTVTHEFPADPATVYGLFTDHDFVLGRLTETGGDDPEVVSLEVTDSGATVVTKQAIPADVLPPMVSSLLQGAPTTERTETWKVGEGDYTAEFVVVIKGAPASLKGTMTLKAAGGGSVLGVVASASVPIPLFGAKIETLVTDNIRELLDSEAAYTTKKLAG